MSKGLRERLIIFTRYPEPGKSKTRMIPVLGVEGAADLQRRMTDHLVSKVKTWIEQRFLAVEIRFEGGSEKLMREWLGPSFSYQHQGRGDIGRRMERAIADGFQDGCESVVIIGSDIPDITNAILYRAFTELPKVDLVLGPANDGGYYLIGLPRDRWNQTYSKLFENVSWGRDRVLSQTLAAANQLGISYVLLDTLCDVDRPEDLAVWNRASQLGSNST